LKVVVLGGGSTGEHFVGALRRLDGDSGLTLVDRRLVGGECSYWACMPTKTMLRATELVAATRRAPGLSPATLDPAGVFGWRDLVVDGRDDSAQVKWLADRRCELVRGDGVVAEPDAVTVDGRKLPYDRLVIATGSSPAVPPVVDGLDYWTNKEATETTEVPGTLLVLGGGPVGCELAQFFARVGSKVTLVQQDERLLPNIDADAAALVHAALEEDGVEVRLNEDASDKESLNRFDRVLVATGRKPNVEGLDALGLTVSERGIEVDERLRAAENVWAIGDVTGIAQFTHVGKYQARVAAADMAKRRAKADYTAIPAGVFTDPEVGTVGRADGDGLVTARIELEKLPRLATYERPKRKGFVRVFADPRKRVLVGAVCVGPQAAEWLGQFTLAIRAEVPVEKLLDTIQPYPTFSEGVFYALQELQGELS
jgi:pyruvate/2-oxoglutarate dehydrogenase complex dihydrolipoamide dehydrogenase (E3) component